jgi:urease accessory protein
VRLRSEPPLVLRWTYDGLRMVAGAGGPLGGDDLALSLRVDAGAAVSVGSAAATVVQRGHAGGVAAFAVSAEVGEGSRLRWAPEPTVVCAGASWHARATVDCAPGSSLRWREVLVLGRYGEPAGEVVSRLDVTVAGEPLLRQETRLGCAGGSATSGPAVSAGRRVLGSLLLVAPEEELERVAGGCPPSWGPVALASMALEGRGLLVTALGDTTVAVHRALEGTVGALPGVTAR